MVGKVLQPFDADETQDRSLETISEAPVRVRLNARDLLSCRTLRTALALLVLQKEHHLPNNYDLIVIGGGISGSSLAKGMAEAGRRVLVLEAETEFKDRVRGEVISPWGVAEARALRIMDALSQAGARELRWADQFSGCQQTEHRDVPATTPAKAPVLTCYHPRMQTTLLNAAEAAGAEVRRGVMAASVVPGSNPRVTHSTREGHEEISARLVVVADGRNSRFRQRLNFPIQREDQSLCLSGALVESASIPEDTLFIFTNPEVGEIIAWAPQGQGRVRAYLGFWLDKRPRLQGVNDFPTFISSMKWTGLADQYFSQARQAGPLATFEGADTWVEHPYRNGVALLGDAAASNDPTWGQGLSLILRGARVLRDCLLLNDDWDAAAHNYAREADNYYGKTRLVAGWLREFFMVTGPVADARRAHALPLIAEDATRFPDLLFSGPDIPIDENTNARFLGRID
jgi:2-polyprenyl-6-methoxyphenol hydroxylase-like FAD-dependent oxidoreductase